MTIKAVVAGMQKEKQKAVTSRFPCRAIMVKNVPQYCELLSELKKISDIRIVQTSELFSNMDVMPKYENLKASKYQNEWLILTGVSEYLRLFSKKEAVDHRFKCLWSYQAPASSTGRIIIPLWGCEAQWFDSALHLAGDLRQQDFYFDCTDPTAEEQKLNLLVLSGMFDQYVGKLDAIHGDLKIGLQDWFDYWTDPSPEGQEFVLLTKRCNSVETTNGSVSIHVVKDAERFDINKNMVEHISEVFVSIMMVNNEIGTIEPIQELAAVAHSGGALFHTDAVQAVGHIPIDVKELGVDMLSASAHKFNGPKGIGFLYVRKGTKIYPYSDGGAQEFGMRAGTENIAAIVGMAVALKKNCDEMTEITENLRRIEAQFIGTLKNAHIDFERNGSERRVPGNISISIRGASGEMLLHRLDLKGIAISTGSACDSVNTQVSHVIRAIGIPAEYAKGTIRVSFGRENTEDDATAIAEALIQILAKK